MRQAYLVDGRLDGAGLALCPARSCVIPVPAAVHIGEPVLLRVQHEKAVPQGDPVHLADRRQRLRVLVATVQHYQQRQAFGTLHARWLVQVVTPGAGRACSQTGAPVRR